MRWEKVSMGNSIIWFIGVALLAGIILTNPTGDRAVANSLSSGTEGIINSLEVSKG